MSKVRLKGPLIIAMQGHPCTGKSTLAKRLAKSFKYPIIAQDDVKHCIAEKELEKPALFTSSSTSPLDRFNDLSFGVICQIALMELTFGSKLIIDSSLQSQAHVDRLIQLSIDTEAQLIIIECKPRDRYEWRQWFEQRCKSQGTPRYKPSTWEDLESLLEIDGGCSRIEGVSKLVVNTTDYVMDRKLAAAVTYLAAYQGSHHMDFHEYCFGSNVSKRIQSDIQNEEEERQGEESEDWEIDTYEVHYHELTLCRLDEENNEYDCDATDDDDDDDEKEEDEQHDDGEEEEEEEEEEEGRCGGCLLPISDSEYYNCEGCYIRAHKMCAELPNKKELMPLNYPTLLQSLPDKYSFPEIHRCKECQTNNNDYSYDECNQCLFETNLRCALLPSILVHKLHEHPLHIQLNPFLSDHKFQCKACGDFGEHACYSCSDSGEDSFEFHLSCALLPQTYKHRTHRHPLSLTCNVDPDDGSDEFYCDACEETRNPNHWLYYCAACHFTCHLKCMTETFQ